MSHMVKGARVTLIGVAGLVEHTILDAPPITGTFSVWKASASARGGYRKLTLDGTMTFENPVHVFARDDPVVYERRRYTVVGVDGRVAWLRPRGGDRLAVDASYQTAPLSALQLDSL